MSQWTPQTGSMRLTKKDLKELENMLMLVAISCVFWFISFIAWAVGAPQIAAGFLGGGCAAFLLFIGLGGYYIAKD